MFSGRRRSGGSFIRIGAAALTFAGAALGPVVASAQDVKAHEAKAQAVTVKEVTLQKVPAKDLKPGDVIVKEVTLQEAPAKEAKLQPFSTEVVKVKKAHRESGMASFYRHEGKTASGMKAQGAMTAAHRRLPFGSKVRVKDMKTGKEVVVVITDRGPFTKGRVIDLSHHAALALGITGRGVAKVELVSD